MREWDGQVGGGMEWDSNEREILIEGVTMGLGRNLMLGNSQASTRMTPVEILGIVKRMPELAFPVVKLVTTIKVIIKPLSNN